MRKNLKLVYFLFSNQSIVSDSFFPVSTYFHFKNVQFFIFFDAQC